MNIYETERLLNEYLLFHYGADDEVLPWDFGPKDALGFAKRSVFELIDLRNWRRGELFASALDLGCAVGASCYELARYCEFVVGVDYSQRFIDAAEAICCDGSLNYLRQDEADKTAPLVAKRPAVYDEKRIEFMQGDAMNLDADLESFEIVHAANLLCRLSDPEKLLDRLPDLVRKGGQLLLTTPCTWLEEFTPPAKWPRGSTFEWLQEKLGGHFTLDARKDLPFLIREHARKFQWSVALGTRWIRK